jgi:dTDP-4-amino-4,6-dideoxygalactose transaminase
MDMADARRKITRRSRVMVLQHTFGIPADVEGARRLAEEHGLVMVEDCVHSLGARTLGRQTGSFGGAAFFSTEETKTISTTMGGMVVTDDPALAAPLRGFQATCAPPSPSLVRRYLTKLAVYHVLMEPLLYHWSRRVYERLGGWQPLPRPTSEEELVGRRPPGYTTLLSNAQATIGLRQLARLEPNLRHRHRLATVYEARLANLGLGLPHPRPGDEPAFVRYPVWVADRSATMRAAARRAVLGTWFTSVLEEARCPTCAGYEPGSCPRAERAAQHLINLPTHPGVTLEDAVSLAALVAGTEARRTVPSLA